MLPTGTQANRKPNVYAFHLNAYICQPFQPGTKRIACFAQISVCFSPFLTENQTYYSNAMDATEERNAMCLDNTYDARERNPRLYIYNTNYVYI